MAKIVNIEWMRLTRDFQCPCCGTNALKVDGNVVSQPCSHFLFSWDGNRQDFSDFTAGVESVLNNSAADLDGPLGKHLVDSLPESAVLFEVTVRDEALGPVVRTDVVAFDPLAA